MKAIYYSIFMSTFLLTATAQEDDWWEKKHNYDGQGHWSEYLIMSPAFMGPNALPVPKVKIGIMEQEFNLELGAASHFKTGAQSSNLVSNLFMPASDRVALEVYLVPIEYYVMDTVNRDVRRLRDFDGKGISGGDFYVNTFFQLIKDHRSLPDVLMTVNIKTASGTNLDAGRFTDTPAYFFDLSFSKNISERGRLFYSVRPYFMGGFYCWQTNLNDYYQDDAFHYGAGIQLKSNRIIIDNNIAGMYGYLNNGDRPILNRFSLGTNRTGRMNFEMEFQQGIFDWFYSSLTFSAILTFNKLAAQLSAKLDKIIDEEVTTFVDID